MRLLTLVLLCLALAACGGDAPAPEPTPDPAPEAPAAARQSVADIVAANPRLRVLARLIESSGIATTLRDTSTAYTLFAPSDEAFAQFGGLAALEADSVAARTALSAHVVATRLLTPDVFADLAIETMAGSEVTFAEVGEGLAVRSTGTTARITDADLDADNGVVHIIDSVLE
ncbi:fasciclin domain-containing protein [Rubrivirga sp. IMCC43871]|uniref:fasciclin domain-containing protein n=1 Tax=Rubrivirga sp. IMCC43871 TaxID=3391575 RepID=UPI00398FF048